MKTIFIVPKMFTSDELNALNSTLPEDYQERTKEFWDYIEEKLRNIRNVQKLYFDSLTTEEQEKALEFIRKNNEKCYVLARKFREAGAKIEATEDPLLVQETISWISMFKKGDKRDFATEEMLAKNMVDREKYIAQRISESLFEGETGILFLAPGRKTNEYIPADLVRIIKIQPFDPQDYLNSWLVTLSLKSQLRNQST
jgi:hypothetical protein